MEEVPPEAPKKTSLGMDENVEGLLTYVLGWLTGIIFLIVEKGAISSVFMPCSLR